MTRRYVRLKKRPRVCAGKWHRACEPMQVDVLRQVLAACGRSYSTGDCEFAKYRPARDEQWCKRCEKVTR